MEDNPFFEVFSSRIRERRIAAGGSAAAAAKDIGISRAYFSNLEVGKNSPSFAQTLANIARAIHTSADYLLGLTDNPEPNKETAGNLFYYYDRLPADRKVFVLDVVKSIYLSHLLKGAIDGGEDEILRLINECGVSVTDDLEVDLLG